MPRQKLSGEAAAAKARDLAKVQEEDMGLSDVPVSPENSFEAHTSAKKMFHGRTIVDMRRHEGGGLAHLRNKVVLKLSDNTETVSSEEELALLGIEAPTALE